MNITPKNIIKRIVLGMDMFRKPSIAYCAKNHAFPDLFVRTPSKQLREFLLLPSSPYQTQLNQDMFALLVNRFNTGFFVEIGANDGYTLSNTVYLEENFNWSGLLIEANPEYKITLQNRKSKAVIAAVVEKEGHYKFCRAGLYGGLTDTLDKQHNNRTKNGDTINVWGTTLESILKDNSAPSIIHFISIDVEGAEVSIINQMCNLIDYRFMCGCIEHNERQEDYQKIAKLLTDAGYRIIWEGQTKHDLFFVDGRGFDR